MKTFKNKTMKWWAGVISYTALFAAIAIFASVKMHSMIRGVEIQAKANYSARSPVATIEGTAENAIYLAINGREIFIDKDGSFKEPIVLLPGLSIVTLHAEDKFGKKSEKQFKIVHEDNQNTIARGEQIITTN